MTTEEKRCAYVFRRGQKKGVVCGLPESVRTHVVGDHPFVSPADAPAQPPQCSAIHVSECADGDYCPVHGTSAERPPCLHKEQQDTPEIDCNHACCLAHGTHCCEEAGKNPDAPLKEIAAELLRLKTYELAVWGPEWEAAWQRLRECLEGK